MNNTKVPPNFRPITTHPSVSARKPKGACYVSCHDLMLVKYYRHAFILQDIKGIRLNSFTQEISYISTERV